MAVTKGVNNLNNNYNYNCKLNTSLNLNNDENKENKINLNNNYFIKNNGNKIPENKNKIFKKNLIKRKEINSSKTEFRNNPLDEYDDLIMKNLFLDEIKNRPNYNQINQLFSKKDLEIRITCINLIISISENFNFKQETIYLTINIFDRCFPQIKVNNNLDKIKIFVLSCIFIASKYEEIYPPFLEDYLDLLNFSKEEIFKLENFILDKINFELHICSPYLFLTKFFYSNSKKEKTDILYLAQLILDISTISIEFCEHNPSFQAVICLYLSRYIYYKNKNEIKLWTKDDEFMTGYSELEIKKNAKFTYTKIKEFFSGILVKDYTITGIYKKYNSDKYLNIAKILRNLF